MDCAVAYYRKNTNVAPDRHITCRVLNKADNKKAYK